MSRPLPPETIHYLTQLEQTILHAASTGSSESSRRLDVERLNSRDGLGGACLELLRRRGWGIAAGGVSNGNVNVNVNVNISSNISSNGNVSRQDAVTFYALTTLQRSPMLACLPPPASEADGDEKLLGLQNYEQFASMRSQLQHLLLSTISHAPSLLSMPSFVATKVGVLLALLVREEYPTRWPSPWQDTWLSLRCQTVSKESLLTDNTSQREAMASLDMCLRFLDGISDEIVYPAASPDRGDHEAGHDDAASASAALSSAHRSAAHSQYLSLRREQVKDALRGFPLGSTGSGAVVTPCIPLEHTDAARIVGWLLDAITKVTSAAAESNATIRNNHGHENDGILEIAVRAAATLKRYLAWVDLRLATHPDLVNCLLNGLGGADAATVTYNSANSNDDDDDVLGDATALDDATPGTLLAVECASCLREIVTRGMEEHKKVALLLELNVFGTLCKLSGLGADGNVNGNSHRPGKLDLIKVDGTQIDAVIAAAELVNTAGLELIPGWELQCQTSATSSSSPMVQPVNLLMNQCLELSLSCLAYDDIDVSGAVIDLVSRILVSLEKKESYWNDCINTTNPNGRTLCNSLLFRILSVLHLRMKYPTDFQFDYEDEDDAEEEIYRTHLRKLYQRIVRFRPQLVLQFIGSCLTSLSQPLSATSSTEIEVALRLVFHFGEGRRPAPGAKTALRDGPFREIVIALHQSDIASHSHREVLLLYYDLAVRYSLLLKDMPELLSSLLGALTGNRGLQHPHPRVRSRCCYFLLRLVKSVGGKAMRPYVEVVVEGIQRLLFAPASSSCDTSTREVFPIPPNDALYLFETTGIMLGTTGLDVELQQRCATAVLTPHIRSIENILASPDLRNDVEHYGEQLSMSVSAIAQLSKGWQNHPPSEVQAVLAAAVNVCRNVLVALPSSPLVRNRTAVLLQRMMICLGEAILQTMPDFLTALLSHSTTEDDVLDTSQLILQLCIKFKDNAVPAIDVAILPFLQKVLAIQVAETVVAPGGKDVSNLNLHKGSTSTLPPHLMTQQLSIRKHAFACLQHIVAHNATAALLSERNVDSIPDILKLMFDGAITAPDPVMKKTCTSFFSLLIQQWGGSNMSTTQVVNAFFDFVHNVFVPGMLDCVLSNSFNVKDALHSRVLAEFGNALWFLKQSSYGNNFNSRVVDAVILGRSNGFDAIGFRNASCGKDMESSLKALKEKKKKK
ncbi:hypothetical protein ACHAXS_005598 [Conticribra weissflogii]